MKYKMYEIHHSRGKSDTNFYQEKTILNGAYSSLKVLRVSVVNDLENKTQNTIKRSITRQNIKVNNNKLNKMKSNIFIKNRLNVISGEGILTLIERILLFKQELDSYFFENKLQCLKFHLDNICSIIIKNINDLKNELINDCPILETSRLVLYLQNFSDVVSTLIDTKPQDLYREIKDAILNQWEINRINIKELFDKIEITCNSYISKDNTDLDLSFIQDEFLNIKIKKDENQSSEDDESINRLKKQAPFVLKYLLNRKKEIKYFISMMTQGILFTISRLYYDMDYYSIIISSLSFKIFYGIMYFIDANKDNIEYLSNQEKSKQSKVYHIICHFINLALTFYKNIQAGEIYINNGGLNSMSKFVINNFFKIIPKCQGIKDPNIFPKFHEPTLFQTTIKNKFYKCYLQRYKKYKDNSLLRIFMLYYNSKMTFWKSVMIEAKSKDGKKTFICRTCEKEIPLKDIFVHLGYCKEQQSFYDKMIGFKSKFEQYITNLFFYLEKLNLNIINNNHNIFRLLTNISKKLNNDENNDDHGINFVKNIIKLYSYEKSKDNNYYEQRPEEIGNLVSMSYFTLAIFLLNKSSNEVNPELSEIFGGIFCTLLQIMINAQFLFYIKKSETKSSIVKGEKELFERRKTRIHSVRLNFRPNIDIAIKENDKKVLKNRDKIDNNLLEEKNIKGTKIDNDDDFLFSEFNFKSEIEKYKSKLSLNNSMASNNSLLISNGELDNSPKKRGNSFIKSSKNLVKTYIDEYKQKKENISISNSFKQNNIYFIDNLNIKNNNNIESNNINKNIEIKNKNNNSNNSNNSNSYHNNNNNISKNNNNNHNVNNHNNHKNLHNNKLGNSASNNYKRCKTKKDGTNSLFLSNLKSKKNQNIKNYDKNLANKRVRKSVVNIFISFDINSYKNDKNKNNNNKFNSKKTNIKKNKSNNYQENKSSGQNKKLSIKNIKNEKEVNDKENNITKIVINDKPKDILKSSNLNESPPKKEINKKRPSLFGSSVLNNKPSINYTKENKISNTNLSVFKKSDKNDNLKNNDSSTEISKQINKCESTINNNTSYAINHYNYEKKEKFKNNSNVHNLRKSKKIEVEEISCDLNFQDSEDSDGSKNGSKEEDEYNNIIIGEKESDIDLPVYLNIDPETKKEIYNEKLLNIFKEMLDGIDIKFEQKFSKVINLRKDFLYDLNNENENYSQNNKNKRKRFDSYDMGYNNSDNLYLNMEKKHIKNINSIQNIKDIYNIQIEKLNKIKEENNCSDEEKEKNQITKVLKFKLILPIAKGGYGSVGLYKKLTTSDTYAIKTVNINCMKEKSLSSTLKNEKNILKEINSDYVVNSYYIFQDKKNYYFVMEYLPGGDVYTLLSKNNLPKKTIQLIVAETILAVNYLHSIRIIHHDIKPENILISAKGHFKLSDFGLSKTLPEKGEYEVEEAHLKNLTDFVEFKKFPINLGDDEDENKDAVGTLNYMSPELFTDKYQHGSGIDYWAIGVLIFDLYSYSLPFEGKNQEETRSNIIGLKIDWNKLINDNVKKLYGNIDSAIDLIKKFLKENPADRWGDKNLDEIKKHKFFDGFNWEDIQNIKNDTVKEYVKQKVKENNEKIKQLNIKNKEDKENTSEKESNTKEDGYLPIIEINLTENEEKKFFTERLDNLYKKNNEIVKKKITKEDNIKGNLSNLMLLDLE